MIRHSSGSDFLLFTQDGHARLSGFLAERIGNGRFAPPLPYQATVDAVAMHDGGWPLHDAEPTLNEQGLPLHVFETPPRVGTRVWGESVRLASARGPYTGLLVSLHAFALSALVQQHFADPAKRQRYAAEVFSLNKFQQSQIEVQEQLRQQLGLRTDMPLQLGLAAPGTSEEEDLLRFDYQLLRAMDQVSLALLCGGQPIPVIESIQPRPGGESVDVRIGYAGPWTVTLTPWPFGEERIEAEVPYRRVPGRKYASVEEFRAAYAGAQEEPQRVRVVRNG